MDNIKTDILIVGAGAAGIAASLSASKSCNNIILAEQLSYVGGLITGGLVTLFCGMEGNESNAIQDVIKEIKKYNGISYIGKDPVVNPEILKIVVEGMLIDRGVKILYNSHAYLVPRLYRMITEVIFKNNEKTIIIEPKVVVDCTGNGDIFYCCGEPYKEYYSKDIPIGLVARIGGITEEAKEYLFNEAGKAFFRGLDVPEYEETATKSIIWFIVNYSDNEYGTDEYKNLTEIMIHLRKKALELSINLKKNKILKDSFLLDTAPLIGVRISRLLEGKSILTEECGRCLCVDCLSPKFTKNLLVAGRCISAELSVMDKMRVIPACFTTGEMAGIAAANLIKIGGGAYK